MSGVSFQPRSFAFPPASNAAAASSYSVPEQQAYEQLVGQGIVTGTGASNSAADEASTAQLHHTLARMALYVRKTRLQLAPFFSDFDRHRQGALSSAQFARVLATAGFSALTHDLVANLAAHYALPGDAGKVSYRSFISDIETIAAAQQQQAHAELQRTTQGPTLEFQRTLQDRPLIRRDELSATGISSRTPFITQHDIHGVDVGSPLTSSKLLHKLQTFCQTNRIILNDIFMDFDPLRKNLITFQRFRRCLDIVGFTLSDEEANILVGAYLSSSTREQNQVEYKRFIKDIESPFIPSHAESSPSGGELPSFIPYQLEDHETPQAIFTNDESERIKQILKELGYQVHTRRILLKPGFQLHDSTRSGCITSRQFSSVLTSIFSFIKFSLKDLDILTIKYRRSNLGVCYSAFIKDVEECEKNAVEYSKTLHPSHAAAHLQATHGANEMQLSAAAASKPAPFVAGMRIVSSPADLLAMQAAQDASTSAESVLARIRESLNRQRMSIEDIFRDYDHLNKGRTTRAQFFRALTQAGLKQLSATDMRVLADRYPHSEIPQDVDYRKFIVDLSTVPRF